MQVIIINFIVFRSNIKTLFLQTKKTKTKTSVKKLRTPVRYPFSIFVSSNSTCILNQLRSVINSFSTFIFYQQFEYVFAIIAPFSLRRNGKIDDATLGFSWIWHRRLTLVRRRNILRLDNTFLSSARRKKHPSPHFSRKRKKPTKISNGTFMLPEQVSYNLLVS